MLPVMIEWHNSTTSTSQDTYAHTHGVHTRQQCVALSAALRRRRTNKIASVGCVTVWPGGCHTVPCAHCTVQCTQNGPTAPA